MGESSAAASGLRGGAARVCITPPVGCALAGYGAREKHSCAVEDDLYARVLVLDDGATRSAIVSLDLIGVPRALAKRLAAEIERRAAVPASNCLACGTHTHFGPVLEQTDYQADELSGSPDEEWLEVLVRKVGGAAEMAASRLVEAQIGAGSAQAPHLAYNRRTIRPNGKAVMTWTLPPAEPNLSFGPTDPEVGVLKVAGTDGAPIAVLLNFACHAVCGGADFYAISADFPGHATALVEEQWGGVCLFLPGAGGNMVPVKRGDGARRQIGRALGACALSLVDFAARVPVGRLLLARAPVALPLKAMPSAREAAERLAKAREEMRARGAGGAGSRFEPAALLRLKHARRLAERFGGQARYRGEVVALGLGDVALVGLPGEVFCEIGLAIKARSGARQCMVVSLVNDSPGYIPTDLAFDQGGYEPEWTPFDRGCEEAMVAAALEAVETVLEGKKEKADGKPREAQG